MSRKKTIRHQQNKSDPLIIQQDDQRLMDIKDHRADRIFHNTNPIVLELACGRAEYSTGLAIQYPDKNFVGIDIKGERLRYGSQNVHTHSLNNVRFFRTIIHHLDRYFGENEVQEIWIIHPDPRSKGVDERRRLTHSRFLAMYRKILVPDGILRLKTDDQGLYQYSLRSTAEHDRELVAQTADLHQSVFLDEHHGIITHYEKKFLKQGKTIHYAKRKNAKSATGY